MMIGLVNPGTFDMKISFFMASTAAVAMALAPPASAQTDGDSLVLGALLGNALSGKTTLGTGAGEIEGWMVVAPLLHSAALKIGEQTKGKSGVLLVNAEPASLGLLGSIQGQVTLYKVLFERPCVAPVKGTEPQLVGAAGGTTLADLIGAAPAPNTDIIGFMVAPTDLALINAIQSTVPGWTRIDDLMMAPSDSQILQDWEGLRVARGAYETGACGKTDDGKAIMAHFDATDAKLSAMGDKGEPSLLDQAARIQTILGSGTNTSILRVSIEKAGGSITNTDSIWTRLGAPAIKLTGALVLSYRVVDPRTGATSKAGLVVCHAPRKTMDQLHRGELPTGAADSCTVFSSI